LMHFHVSLEYVTTTMLLQGAKEMHVTRCEVGTVRWIMAILRFELLQTATCL
jgi:hypothetical protein